MGQVNIHHAKTHLSRLLKEVEAGGEVVIARGGKPIARLVPIEAPRTRAPRKLGAFRGQFTVPDDFDAPLPDDLLDLFES